MATATCWQRGIGLPGTVHPVTGDLSRAPNLPAMPSHDLPGVLSARLDLPVAVENDVTLAALGECWRGHGAESAAVCKGGLAFVALGTGIGMGLAWGDRMLRGARGAAGEIAWLPIGGDPADRQIHESGALESVVAGEVLAESYRARGGSRHGTTLPRADPRQRARSADGRGPAGACRARGPGGPVHRGSVRSGAGSLRRRHRIARRPAGTCRGRAGAAFARARCLPYQPTGESGRRQSAPCAPPR